MVMTDLTDPRLHYSDEDASIAYFSMEIGIDPNLPTYSGGLGILAGDTLRSGADIGVPMVGVTLLYRKGYFRQQLDEKGNQVEHPVDWSPEQYLEKLPITVEIKMNSSPVHVAVWRYRIDGCCSGRSVPILFLDTDLPENTEYDRRLTDTLYGGDLRYRLFQEAVLGLGGIAVLEKLGYRKLRVYHMNEGHSALLTIALLRRRMDDKSLVEATEEDLEAVRQRCVFTTHTPVPAGHDQFPMELVQEVLGEERTQSVWKIGCCLDNKLNMTYLALFFSRFINGVAMKHGKVSKGMFPHYPINSITNGVHAVHWTSDSFRRLFDRYIPEWRKQNLNLRYAISIPKMDILQAHLETKRVLLEEVKRRTGRELDPSVFTMGFARRATGYKRGDLIFRDIERLRKITERAGSIQILFAGKAHPKDDGGKAVIQKIHEASEALRGKVDVVYLEGYEMRLGKLMTSGVDLWLNTPQKPREASGTSGMKAALNGVPSLSILDGWWIEGCVDGVTGWYVGEAPDTEPDPVKEAESLYSKLEHQIIPTFYRDPSAYAEIMRWAISLNGSFFNTQRMLVQYVENAYEISRY